GGAAAAAEGLQERPVRGELLDSVVAGVGHVDRAVGPGRQERVVRELAVARSGSAPGRLELVGGERSRSREKERRQSCGGEKCESGHWRGPATPSICAPCRNRKRCIPRLIAG